MLKFTKMHGAGNDYVYIDARNLQEEDWASLSIDISDRHKGVGSDGLILLLDSENGDIRMRMFNSDGSEGEMCGNGIRCLVGFAQACGAVSISQKEVIVETAAGTLSVFPIIEHSCMIGARVSMGLPELSPSKVPVKVKNFTSDEPLLEYPIVINQNDLKISCVSMGNPHAVAFVEEPIGKFNLLDIGPIIEHHPMFPNRVNFEVVNFINRTSLNVRVWERGSGITQACGTGACAVAVVAHLLGMVDDEVIVSLPGGDLIIRWPGEGNVEMEGPIETVFEGEWSL